MRVIAQFTSRTHSKKRAKMSSAISGLIFRMFHAMLPTLLFS